MLCLSPEPAYTDISILSLHDALPICDLDEPSDCSADVEVGAVDEFRQRRREKYDSVRDVLRLSDAHRQLTVFEEPLHRRIRVRSEEHTSELQSQSNLVCRLLLEKKKK